MTSRRALFLGAAAALAAPAALAVAPAPQVLAALPAEPAAARWVPKVVKWMLPDDFDEDGCPHHLTRDRHSLAPYSGADGETKPPAHGEVRMLRYYAEYPPVMATVHPYDEDADDYPPLTIEGVIPTDPQGSMIFAEDGVAEGSLSIEDALEDRDPGTYEVNLYTYSDPIPHRWDALAQRFIPLEPVAHDEVPA